MRRKEEKGKQEELEEYIAQERRERVQRGSKAARRELPSLGVGRIFQSALLPVSGVLACMTWQMAV